MTTIDKIRAEIERLYGKYETKYHETRLPYVEGLLDGFDLIEQFLDTLEELRESEDEKVRKFLVRLAERCSENSIDFIGDIKKADVLTWLEKQKDSGPKSSDNWKPSEDQMNILLNTECMIRASGYPENAKVLASLYKQLKKL